jgi:hypothetical protein
MNHCKGCTDPLCAGVNELSCDADGANGAGGVRVNVRVSAPVCTCGGTAAACPMHGWASMNAAAAAANAVLPPVFRVEVF